MTPVVGRPEAPDELEEHVDLGVVERGGRLVHDEHLRVERQRLGDLDHLLAGDREPLDGLRRVEREAEPVEQLLRAPVQRAVVEEDARAALLAADEDVLRDREVGHQVELLVDDADALLLGVPRPVEHELVPVHAEHAGVGRVDAGEQLHERRLAGAVLADEREHLAEAQLEVHVVERLHAGESLAHALQFEERGGCRGVHRAARSGPASRTTPLRRMRLPYGRGSPVRTTSRAARARS